MNYTFKIRVATKPDETSESKEMLLTDDWLVVYSIMGMDHALWYGNGDVTYSYYIKELDKWLSYDEFIKLYHENVTIEFKRTKKGVFKSMKVLVK